MRVLVVDNYDSFTYNLVQYLGELGAEVQTVRNDRATVDELLEQRYERCVVTHDVHVGAELAEVLHEVVRERVVVVDDANHA